MTSPDEPFSPRAVADDDLRAAAAEFEEWQDAVNAAVPDPTPETLFSDALPTNP